mgnify:CR=1 FL=1
MYMMEQWQEQVDRQKRMESIRIKLPSTMASEGKIEYKSHIENIGWEKSWKKTGELSGTTGKSLRLEAIQIKLSGDIAEKYDVYYRVHAENFGWLGWLERRKIRNRRLCLSFGSTSD